MTIKEGLTEFILEELATDHEMESLEENAPLLEFGIIDSLAIMKLLAFIEEEFKLKVLDEELIPENFETIASILKLIEKKQTSMTNSIPS
ncbi:MAG: acyl carrier protein [Candidatus Hodarchaeota archaeon]